MRARFTLSLGTVLLAAAGTLGACSSPSDDASQQPSGAAASSMGAPAAQGALPGTGQVTETMDTGGYTYVCVDMGGKEVWAAGPQIAVKKGDTVSLPAGMAMTNYHSNTLNRTFPLVYFVGAIQVGGAPSAGMPAMSTEAADAMAAAAHKSAAAAPAAAAGPVARVDGGQTVEEIVTKSADFAGKDIVVRGRVVKYMAGIMGTNWLHLQDGTGAAGTNDRTVTSDTAVAVGDVVVVRGKVTTDKDFGAGYQYAVIVEKAAVTKE